MAALCQNQVSLNCFFILRFLQVLIPIADTGEFPVNLAAIKMMTKVVEKLTKEEAEECLHEVIPKLVKVSLTCLLAINPIDFASVLNSE